MIEQYAVRVTETHTHTHGGRHPIETAEMTRSSSDIFLFLVNYFPFLVLVGDTNWFKDQLDII